MSKEKITKARDLIDAGSYREARKTLKGVKDPAASRLLSELDELDERPVRSGGGLVRDILHVLLIGLIGALLFGGIGFAIAMSQGLKIGTAVALNTSPSDNGTPRPQPTVAPTATDIPCEAQAWWDTNGAAINKALLDAINLDIELRPADIQAAQANFQTWQAAFAAEPVAPCLAPVQSAVASATASVEAFYAAHLTTTTDQERAQKFLTMMSDLLPLADAVTALNLNPGTDIAWAQGVQDFTRADCPASRWFVETMIVRNYQRFFTLLGDVDFQNKSVAEIQAVLLDMRGLQSAFETDGVAFPACVKPASDHFLSGMKEFINTINTLLNGDNAASEAHLQAARTAINGFFSELSALDDDLASSFQQPGF